MSLRKETPELNRREFAKGAASLAVSAAVWMGGTSEAVAEEPNGLTSLTMVEAARKLRAREITATALVQAFLDR